MKNIFRLYYNFSLVLGDQFFLNILFSWHSVSLKVYFLSLPPTKENARKSYSTSCSFAQTIYSELKGNSFFRKPLRGTTKIKIPLHRIFNSSETLMDFMSLPRFHRLESKSRTCNSNLQNKSETLRNDPSNNPSPHLSETSFWYESRFLKSRLSFDSV